ncbi:hypothetical protein [Agromyces italicus]|uniref:hypothetical protein n=1 Tax=Agromyces italicus TaxID=279572 RepID=UPI0004126751|nr:hypothetical protein [Agromyces italicus]
MFIAHLRSHLSTARLSTRPLRAGVWPASARIVGHDLVVDGNSMLELARAIGTPCTRTSAAAAAATAGGERFASVIVTRVLAVDELPEGVLAPGSTRCSTRRSPSPRSAP